MMARGTVPVSPIDYSSVTEVPGGQTTPEGLSMLLTRYRQAAQLSVGGDVLEIACGSGVGLGALAGGGRFVVGGDYTFQLLTKARDVYRGAIPLIQLDAQALPFRSESFDLVVLYEAIYYLQRAEVFMQEAHRVLKRSGTLLICTVNPQWPDFNPSPYSTRYWSAVELKTALGAQGFDADMAGAFPHAKAGARDHVLSALKRGAIALGLIPRTMKGKEVLKRLFVGRLVPIPSVLADASATAQPLSPLDGALLVDCFKVIYARARKRDAHKCQRSSSDTP